jgi:hypothetical protein
MASMSPARSPRATARARALARALTLTFLTAFLTAAVIAGCGSGDDEPASAPAPTFAIPAAPTLADPGTINLTPTTGALGYTVDMPPGWIALPAVEGGEDDYRLMDGERLIAQMTMLCETPLVRDGRQLEAIEHINNDIALVRELGGQYDTPETFTVRNTIPAASLRYVTQLGPLTVQHKVVHFIIGDCHWTLRLRVYAPGSAIPYETLFDRVVQTFTPA